MADNLRLGAQGYLLKDSAVSDIVAGLKTVMSGRNFISPSLSTFLVSRARRATSLVEHKPSILDLTPTERRVLKLIAENNLTSEIRPHLCPRITQTYADWENLCQVRRWLQRSLSIYRQPRIAALIFVRRLRRLTQIGKTFVRPCILNLCNL